jgi:hypothetical protein
MIEIPPRFAGKPPVNPDGSSSHHSPKSLAEFEKLLILVIVVGM